MNRTMSIVAVIPVLALGLCACGSSDAATGASSSTFVTSSMPPTPQPSNTSAPAPSSATAEATAEAVLSIVDFEYDVPTSVAPGATITIKNSDRQAHSVTSKAGGFDVKVAPDGTATLRAPSKAGSYPIVCTFHGNMTSTLVVK